MRVKSGLRVKRGTKWHVFTSHWQKEQRIQSTFLPFHLTQTSLHLASALSIISTTWAIKIHLYRVPADRNPWYPTLTCQYDIQNISNFTFNNILTPSLHWMDISEAFALVCGRTLACAFSRARAPEIPVSQPCRSTSYTEAAVNGWWYNHANRCITHVAIISSKILNQ